MKKLTRIGIDLAKNVFHLVAMDGRGKVLWRKALARRNFLEFMVQQEAATVGIEACATANHWGRELEKLGHRVKLIHPRFVTPYRKNDKNDFNDAEAICEALSRPTMRFVELKSLAQQDMQSLHQARRLLIKQRTQSANQLRGLLAEYGHIAPRGLGALRKTVAELSDGSERLSGMMRTIAAAGMELLALVEGQLKEFDRGIGQACRADERCQRLAEVKGIGPITATAAVAKVGNAQQFTKARSMGAFLGLVARQDSSGGKTVLRGITKRGDRYLRTLLIHGARAALRTAAARTDPLSRWALALKQSKGTNVAAVALANKHARIIWKLLSSGERFNPQRPATTAAERAQAAQAAASPGRAGRRLALRPEHGTKDSKIFSPSSRAGERTAKKSRG